MKYLWYSIAIAFAGNAAATQPGFGWVKWVMVAGLAINALGASIYLVNRNSNTAQNTER